MDDDSILRANALKAIQAGRLPDRSPDKVWGGPGTGAKCVICGAATAYSETELELEFAPGQGAVPQSYIVHGRCFSSLERESLNRAAEPVPAAEQAQPVSPGARAGTPWRQDEV